MIHVAVALALGAVLVGVPGPAAAGGGPAAHSHSAARCPKSPAKRSFGPTHARIGVLHHTYKVIRVRRVRGAIGTPPVTTRGKHLVGWDHAVQPGARHGTVVMDAHTWPDGSALGNALLGRLHKGNLIRVSHGRRAICYRIVKRHSYPRARIPMSKIVRAGGHPRLAIIVCSGTRLGPGNWLRRTVWIGVPTK
ncbi:MAG TPA: class F sortase [Marmoricola sp.]